MTFFCSCLTIISFSTYILCRLLSVSFPFYLSLYVPLFLYLCSLGILSTQVATSSSFHTSLSFFFLSLCSSLSFFLSLCSSFSFFLSLCSSLSFFSIFVFLSFFFSIFVLLSFFFSIFVLLSFFFFYLCVPLFLSHFFSLSLSFFKFLSILATSFSVSLTIWISYCLSDSLHS